MRDQIIIEELELWAHLGVPEAERKAAQRLTVTLVLEPLLPLAGLGDDIERTIDYAAVCATVKALAARQPRRLVETLAEEIMVTLLETYPLAAVEVRLHKFILPETKSVGVRLRRER